LTYFCLEKPDWESKMAITGDNQPACVRRFLQRTSNKVFINGDYFVCVLIDSD